jgi:putative membrane protein
MQLHLPDFFLGDLVVIVIVGLVATLLIALGYIIFDRLTPRLDFNDLLAKGNLAMAVVLGSFILGVCYVMGKVISAILGG